MCFRQSTLSSRLSKTWLGLLAIGFAYTSIIGVWVLWHYLLATLSPTSDSSGSSSSSGSGPAESSSPWDDASWATFAGVLLSAGIVIAFGIYLPARSVSKAMLEKTGTIQRDTMDVFLLVAVLTLCAWSVNSIHYGTQLLNELSHAPTPNGTPGAFEALGVASTILVPSTIGVLLHMVTIPALQVSLLRGHHALSLHFTWAGMPARCRRSCGATCPHRVMSACCCAVPADGNVNEHDPLPVCWAIISVATSFILGVAMLVFQGALALLLAAGLIEAFANLSDALARVSAGAQWLPIVVIPLLAPLWALYCGTCRYAARPYGSVMRSLGVPTFLLGSVQRAAVGVTSCISITFAAMWIVLLAGALNLLVWAMPSLQVHLDIKAACWLMFVTLPTALSAIKTAAQWGARISVVGSLSYAANRAATSCCTDTTQNVLRTLHLAWQGLERGQGPAGAPGSGGNAADPGWQWTAVDPSLSWWHPYNADAVEHDAALMTVAWHSVPGAPPDPDVCGVDEPDMAGMGLNTPTAQEAAGFADGLKTPLIEAEHSTPVAAGLGTAAPSKDATSPGTSIFRTRHDMPLDLESMYSRGVRAFIACPAADHMAVRVWEARRAEQGKPVKDQTVQVASAVLASNALNRATLQHCINNADQQLVALGAAWRAGREEPAEPTAPVRKAMRAMLARNARAREDSPLSTRPAKAVFSKVVSLGRGQGLRSLKIAGDSEDFGDMSSECSSSTTSQLSATTATPQAILLPGASSSAASSARHAAFAATGSPSPVTRSGIKAKRPLKSKLESSGHGHVVHRDHSNVPYLYRAVGDGSDYVGVQVLDPETLRIREQKRKDARKKVVAGQEIPWVRGIKKMLKLVTGCMCICITPCLSALSLCRMRVADDEDEGDDQQQGQQQQQQPGAASGGAQQASRCKCKPRLAGGPCALCCLPCAWCCGRRTAPSVQAAMWIVLFSAWIGPAGRLAKAIVAIVFYSIPIDRGCKSALYMTTQQDWLDCTAGCQYTYDSMVYYSVEFGLAGASLALMARQLTEAVRMLQYLRTLTARLLDVHALVAHAGFPDNDAAVAAWSARLVFVQHMVKRQLSDTGVGAFVVGLALSAVLLPLLEACIVFVDCFRTGQAAGSCMTFSVLDPNTWQISLVAGVYVLLAMYMLSTVIAIDQATRASIFAAGKLAARRRTAVEYSALVQALLADGEVDTASSMSAIRAAALASPGHTRGFSSPGSETGEFAAQLDTAALARLSYAEVTALMWQVNYKGVRIALLGSKFRLGTVTLSQTTLTAVIASAAVSVLTTCAHALYAALSAMV